MKKKLFLVLVLTFALFALVACSKSKTGKCYLCGKENVKVKSLEENGETIWCCDDCYDQMKQIIELEEKYLNVNK